MDTNKNSGYIGYKMSKNADIAHKNGQFPITNINSKMLKDNGFEYSVPFFKWLCNKQYIIPIAWHHTGASSTMTAFYSPKTISYVAEKYNLSLLYQIYLGKITKPEAINKLQIHFVKAKVISSALGFKFTEPLILYLIKSGEYYYLTKEKKFILNDRQIQILQAWETHPSQGWFNKEGKSIIRMLLCKK